MATYNGVQLSKYNSAPISVPLVASGGYGDLAQAKYDYQTGGAQRALQFGQLGNQAGYQMNGKMQSFKDNPYGGAQTVMRNVSNAAADRGFGPQGAVATEAMQQPMHDLNTNFANARANYALANQQAKGQFNLSNYKTYQRAANFGFNNGIWRVPGA